MKPPIEGMKEIPLYWDNPMMKGAWFGFIHYAIGNPDIRAQFKAETNFSLESIARASGLERMIDESTGHTKAIVIGFLDWVTKRHWGAIRSRRRKES